LGIFLANTQEVKSSCTSTVNVLPQ
jgi:hypothetical protein